MNYRDTQASRTYYLSRNSNLKVGPECGDTGAFVTSVLLKETTLCVFQSGGSQSATTDSGEAPNTLPGSPRGENYFYNHARHDLLCKSNSG